MSGGPLLQYFVNSIPDFRVPHSGMDLCELQQFEADIFAWLRPTGVRVISRELAVGDTVRMGDKLPEGCSRVVVVLEDDGNHLRGYAPATAFPPKGESNDVI